MIALSALATFVALVSHTSAAQELVLREEGLSVVIKGKQFKLEVLTARQPMGDKLPVALITHGSPGNQRDTRSTRASGFSLQARDLAHRGWLAVVVIRRGFGESEGTAAEVGPCAGIDYRPYFSAQADDLEAALQAISQRSDADTTRVIAIGVSAGGPSALELASRSSSRLAAVVNVSGGISTGNVPFEPGSGCASAESELVWTFARLGTTTRVPTLWLYAENDLYFRPSLVSRMHAAYTGAGGNARLVTFPPTGNDGHAIFGTFEGKRLWLPELDQFLRANNLPTWNESPFATLLVRSKPQTRAVLVAYMKTGPSEKALAVPTDNRDGARWWGGAASTAVARTKALEECRTTFKTDCKIIAENFRPIEN